MRIVIVGAGQVGFHLAEKLSHQGQDVTVVDADPECGEYLRDRLDVMTIEGNGTAIPVLEEAGLGGVGPLDNYAWIGAPSQAALVFLMLAGRLELFTVLLLFHPDLWRPHGTRGIFRRA